MRLTIGTWSSIDNTIYFLLERDSNGSGHWQQITLASIGLSGSPMNAIYKEMMIATIEYAVQCPLLIVDNTKR